ncbi:hypothetical protein B0H12DRAFT_1081232 [Mycena haematopus]|nr:hypothetical protein B0H12DRAFT_1081232 [Mycena haematopus]
MSVAASLDGDLYVPGRPEWTMMRNPDSPTACDTASSGVQRAPKFVHVSVGVCNEGTEVNVVDEEDFDLRRSLAVPDKNISTKIYTVTLYPYYEFNIVPDGYRFVGTIWLPLSANPVYYNGMPATSTSKRFKAHESQIDEGKLVLEELSTITDQVHIGSLPQVACMSCIILGKKYTPVAFGSQCGNCYNSSTSYCSYNTDAKFVVDTVRCLGPWMGASPEFFCEAVHKLDEAISAFVAACIVADEAALCVAKWFSHLSTGAIALIDKFGPTALFQCFDDTAGKSHGLCEWADVPNKYADMDRLSYRLTDALINGGLDWNSTPPLTCSMGKTVICTCPECLQRHVVVHGQRIQGRRVTQQLRRIHELKATANRSPDYAKAHNSHPVGIEEIFDEGEDDKNRSGSSAGAQYLYG